MLADTELLEQITGMRTGSSRHCDKPGKRLVLGGPTIRASVTDVSQGTQLQSVQALQMMTMLAPRLRGMRRNERIYLICFIPNLEDSIR